MKQGADRNRKTADGETAVELVEEDDYKTIAVLMNTKEEMDWADLCFLLGTS